MYLEKSSPYECGFQPFDYNIQKFDVKYYLIALIFLIFDLEIMFLIPAIISLSFLSYLAFFNLMLFLFLLLLGFFYEWNKGALDWN